jgi:formimidoylglutamate deiminase
VDVIFADYALVGDEIRANVRISITEGRLGSVEIGAQPQAGDERHTFVLPGMPNLHSHTFQRAMAGLAETRGPGADSFWSWRTVMYQFGLSMNPEQLEAIAAQAFMEMVEQGFSRVGEFHYLHHDRDGSLYANPAEHLDRVAAAAGTTGIGLTMLPVFYAHSGFGGQAPADGQRRFIHDLDQFARLMERGTEITRELPGSNLGLAPHSLRAVTPEELSALTTMTTGPIHIHVAEQVKEVEDCIAWSGARPVEWLLDHALVNGRWCLVHATHVTEKEVTAMANSGAIAGLCPVTEANLGDGIFPVSSFIAQGGRYGVGSDSNVSISLREELQILEYSQRLAERSRNVIAAPGQSTGVSLFTKALTGGAQALQSESGIVSGAPADLFSLDLSNVPWSAKHVIDQWIFGAGIGIDCAWVRGRKLVSGGRHIGRDQISTRFRKVVSDLMAAG